MRIVESVKIPYGEGTIKFPGTKSKAPQISVLIGPNGSRKSLILREIVLVGARIQRRLEESSSSVVFSRYPKKIIAISAAPTDRFPSHLANGVRGRNSIADDSIYSYVGPRTSQNLISRNQSARLLVYEIATKADKLKSSLFCRDLLKYIGVSSVLNISFRLKRMFEDMPIDAVINDLLNSKESNRLFIRFPHEFQNASKEDLNEISAEFKELATFNKRSGRIPAYLTFNSETADLLPAGLSLRAIRFGLGIGYLDVAEITVGDLNQEALSAGQWALFSSLLTLALIAEDDSLLLIDEPENGLHPEWQRDYLSYVVNALGEASNCHVVVATHSPLILSSLPLNNSDVFSLTRRDGQIFPTKLDRSTSGWNTTSLLEEVFDIDSARGKQLSDSFNDVLSLIAIHGIDSKREIAVKLRALQPLVENLPEDDLLRSTFRSLFATFVKEANGST